MSITKWNWFLLIILSLVWGSSFILIKKALISLSPIQVASLRLSFAALAFTPFFFRECVGVSRREWYHLLLVALTGSAIPAFLYALAQTKIASSTTGILNSLTPLFTLLIGIWFFRVKGSWYKLAGVLIGLTGATLLIAPSKSTGDGSVFYALFILLGCICYATSGNIIKHYFKVRSAFSISTLAYTSLGPLAIIILFSTDFTDVLQQDAHALYSVLVVLFLAIVGTALASILYFKLVQDTDALFAATVSYLIPVVAMILGSLDGENLQWIHLLGLLLISSGIYLSRR